MALEIRILSGSRAGEVQRFEQNVILVGRLPTSDLRFDPQEDLDVSGRHAEIRHSGGRYTVIDHGSTNGTWVNGAKVEAPRTIADKDRVKFGAHGPEVEINFYDPAVSLRLQNTEQRVALAVSRRTAKMKRAMIAAVAVLAVVIAGAVAFARRGSAERDEVFARLIAANDSMRLVLQGSMAGAADTALINAIQRRVDELQARLPAATSDAERATIMADIEDNRRALTRMVAMDLPAIHRANAPAVAIIITEIDGRSTAGSGFSVSPDGLLLTNRHNVRDSLGRGPTRIAVKFTETHEWLPARVEAVSDSADLALVRVERNGPFPVIAAVSAAGADASEGMSVVTIGYPLGYETPMEGRGNDFLAKSTLNPGTVSKRTSSVLQIDSYATHGSSGSPVFNARGHVVGVVYGGQREAGGRMVYAVPSPVIAQFLPAALRGIVRD